MMIIVIKLGNERTKVLYVFIGFKSNYGSLLLCIDKTIG
jgi:hypothetical protein